MIKRIIRAITPYWLVRQHQLRKERNAVNFCAVHNDAVTNDVDVQNDTSLTSISFNICNFCNSRCVMCNVWKEKPQKTLSLEEFETVIRDSVFNNLLFINFVGGEPTLIANLEDYFDTALRTLPNLSGVGITTNALEIDRLKAVVRKATVICDGYGKTFALQLSVDGYGETHDQHRGCTGSFDQTISLIEWLKEEGVPFNLAATITKMNVWNMDQYLSFLKRENLYSRFRVASFLNRLLNNENKDVIRNFDEDDKYQLMLFFYKLELSYETNLYVKNMYASTRNILFGGERLVNCTYIDKDWAVLDYNGDLYCCSVKSEIKGNLLKEPGELIYRRSYQEIPDIQRTYCDDCIHDCSSGIPNERYNQIIQEEQRYQHLFTIQKYFELRHHNPVVLCEIPSNNRYTIFITGWYGTETTGDKAILGDIIDVYKERMGDVKILISSLYPFITKRTIYELGIEAEVVPVNSADFFLAAASADETIVGGGPLMELEQLSLISWAFRYAKKHGKKTKVYGCGVGPLFTDEKKDAVKEIFSLADEIYLRDEYSKVQAEAMSTRNKQCINIGDPAVKYIQKIGSRLKVEKDDRKLSLFLRDLSYHEYFKQMDYEEFLTLKERYEQGLAENIRYLYAKEGLIPHFYAMNNFIVGADDRDYNFYFVEKYLNDIDAVVDQRLSTVERVAEQVLSSRFNVCMRYHSVVFAHALHTKFAPIDYTRGGKIPAYLSDHAPDIPPITLEQIAANPDCLYKAMFL